METDIKLHVVFVCAWVHKDGKFLMAKRSSKDKQAPGVWAMPGGKVDDEVEANIITNTLQRELREEVGIEIEDNLIFLGSQSFIRSSGHHVVNVMFRAEYKSGEAQPLEDQEEVKWMDLAEIDQLVNGDGGLSYLKSAFAKLQATI